MKCRLFTRFALLALLMGLLAPTNLLAATLTVTSVADTVAADTVCTLREAIANANNDAATNTICGAGTGVDTIVFNVPGGAGSIAPTTALPNISGTDALTIDASDQTIDIDGTGVVAARVLTVNAGAVLTLDSLTISKAPAGAIYNAGTITLNNCILADNIAGAFGAALYNDGTATLNDSSFTNNSVAFSGGALFNAGVMTINNGTFTSNKGIGLGASGGAIWNNGNMGTTLQISNSVFTTNTAGSIGGAIAGSLALTISNSTFTGNTAAASGGALAYLSGTASITNSTFTNNNGGTFGGAIINGQAPGGNLTVANSTFSGNTAASFGGAIHNNTGTLQVFNSTFSGNLATGGSGGGIFNTSSSTATVTNSTFADNTAAGGSNVNNANVAASFTLINSLLSNGGMGLNCAGLFTDGGGNYDDATSCAVSNSAATIGLNALASNGGPTQTRELISLNPAVDFTCPTGDQRGVSRGPFCDSGAYEKGATFDLGDAPDPTYPTLLASNGAAHVFAPGPSLGSLLDTEAEGLQDPAAAGDGADDDGITGPLTFVAGGMSNDINVTVTNPMGGLISAWVDFDQSGSWEASERVANQLTATAVTVVPVSVPLGAPVGTYFVRLRICTAPDVCNTPTGVANDGEVEDYAFTVTAAGGGGGGGGGDNSNNGINVLGLFRIGAADPYTLALLAVFGLWSLRRRR